MNIAKDDNTLLNEREAAKVLAGFSPDPLVNSHWWYDPTLEDRQIGALRPR